MKEPMGLGDVVNASFSEKVNLAAGALSWWGWYTLCKSFWEDFQDWRHRKQWAEFRTEFLEANVDDIRPHFFDDIDI